MCTEYVVISAFKQRMLARVNSLKDELKSSLKKLSLFLTTSLFLVITVIYVCPHSLTIKSLQILEAAELELVVLKEEIV